MAQRKALLVAIDDYGHPANNLNSCIADSRTFESVLRSNFGFTDLRMLHDAQATLANVENQLAWLFNGVRPDDRLVLHFSGHGYQTARSNLLEEVLVLRDGFLFDDSLSSKTQTVPPGVLTVILDSCFSGGMEKIPVVTDSGLEIAKAKRWTPVDADLLEKEFTLLAPGTKVAFKPFGAALAVTTDQLAKEFRPYNLPSLVPAGAAPAYATAGDAKAFVVAPPSDEVGQLEMNGLLLSASLENETASAKTSQTNGLSAFTFGLVQSLNASGPNVTSVDIMTSVQQRLKNLGFRQTPLLKEPTNQQGLGRKSFVLLGASSSDTKPITGVSSPVNHDQIVSSVLEAIQAAFRKGQPMSAIPVSVAPAPSPTNGTPAATVGDEKFWGAFASIVASVAPSIIQALTKAYDPNLGTPAMKSSAPAAVGDEKFWGAFASIVASVAPSIIQALTKEYQPDLGTPVMKSGTPAAVVADEKFWGAFASIVASVAPSIIQALTKAYDPNLGTPAMKSSTPTAAVGDEKFWGAFASIVASVAPSIIQALTKAYDPNLGTPAMKSGAPAAVVADEKFWGTFGDILTTVGPTIFQALSKEYQPDMAYSYN